MLHVGGWFPRAPTCDAVSHHPEPGAGREITPTQDRFRTVRNGRGPASTFRPIRDAILFWRAASMRPPIIGLGWPMGREVAPGCSGHDGNGRAGTGPCHPCVHQSSKSPPKLCASSYNASRLDER